MERVPGLQVTGRFAFREGALMVSSWPVPAEEVAGDWLGPVARVTEGARKNGLGGYVGRHRDGVWWGPEKGRALQVTMIWEQ